MAQLEKKLATGATLVFVDEAGFGLTPATGKTWALRGETPVLKHAWRAYARISAISGITTDQRLFFQLKRHESFKGPDVARFLRLLLRHIRGEIIVVWDGGPQHRSKAVRELHEKTERLTIVRIPAYCPELNPDEKVWNHAKNVLLRAKTPNSMDQLVVEIRRAFRTMKNAPGLLASLLRASELPWGSALT